MATTRDAILLGLGTALGISIIGNGIILLDSGQTQTVQIVKGSIELTSTAKSALSTKMLEEGIDKLTCARGVISNRLDKLYCSEGSTGLLLDSLTDVALISEVESKLQDVVANELVIQLDENGKLYANTTGVRTIK